VVWIDRKQPDDGAKGTGSGEGDTLLPKKGYEIDGLD